MTAGRRRSSAIKAMRYMPTSGRLHVESPGGRRRFYAGVSRSEGFAFREDESRGRALTEIKANHRYAGSSAAEPIRPAALSRCSCGSDWTDYQPHREDDGLIVYGRFDNICSNGHRELDLMPGEIFSDAYDPSTGNRLMRPEKRAKGSRPLRPEAPTPAG
jgi:hypothetical protein